MLDSLTIFLTAVLPLDIWFTVPWFRGSALRQTIRSYNRSKEDRLKTAQKSWSCLSLELTPSGGWTALSHGDGRRPMHKVSQIDRKCVLVVTCGATIGVTVQQW